MPQLIVSKAELEAIGEHTLSNNRNAKLNWWHDIREKYGLDRDRKYKVGLETGTIRDKRTSLPVVEFIGSDKIKEGYIEPIVLAGGEDSAGEEVASNDFVAYVSSDNTVQLFGGPHAAARCVNDPKRGNHDMILRVVLR